MAGLIGGEGVEPAFSPDYRLATDRTAAAATQHADTLYGRDFAAWASDQSARLRGATSGDTAGLDWLNLAEEIEALGRRDRGEVASHIGTIAEHLIKLIASPAAPPRAGWSRAIERARSELELVLRDGPSLRSALPSIVEDRLPSARRSAERALRESGEQPRAAPASLDFGADEMVSDWWPGDPNSGR